MKKALALGALGAIAAALALAMLAGADDGKSNLRSEDDNGALTMAAKPSCAVRRLGFIGGGFSELGPMPP